MASTLTTSPSSEPLTLASLQGKVAVVDLKTLAVAQTVNVPAAPQEVLVRPDGAIAYVSCDISGKIAAIRTSDWKVDALIDAGKAADGLAWATSLTH